MRKRGWNSMLDLNLKAEPPGELAAAEGSRGWFSEFESWATPEEESETSIAPLALILGLALVVQYAQLLFPTVAAFLQEGNILYRTHWIMFTMVKQWLFFALLWVVLRASDLGFAQIGFPRVGRHRIITMVGLIGFFLAVAVLHRPGGAPQWMLPIDTSERLLWVGLAVTTAVVEETLFRGFAIVWAYRWGGHLGLAVALPAVVFAAGHVVLSLANTAIALAGALVFSGLFLWRRELYWPMVLHFLINSLDLLF